ncbi:hypothetical protein BN2476_350201 [Paraburkholderia piptadeniae]|uniref:Uncharacterized protein n=1 Tax=Paraburkholderia piptadeniae TaxID=1701573 RepID=A0A1N7S8B1_9BURK|nr:hypothetical protein BN2476_350201 [Paraburkholderia piptadeniae]
MFLYSIADAFPAPNFGMGLWKPALNGGVICYIRSDDRLAMSNNGGAAREIDDWIVIPVVVGSSPISHPKEFSGIEKRHGENRGAVFVLGAMFSGPVAFDAGRRT